MWYTKLYIEFQRIADIYPLFSDHLFSKTEDMIMKNFWRALWLAAVSLGGVALVRVALEILNRENKKYIDV